MTLTDVSERLRELDDRHQLRDLTVRYCLAIDDSDWAGLLDMFTAEAQFGDTRGRENVVELLRSIRSTYGRTIHTANGQTLRLLDADHASAIVPSHAELDIQGQTVLCAMRYYDDYEREDGTWRFARRSVKFSYALPFTEMSGALTDPLPVRWPGTAPAAADEI